LQELLRSWPEEDLSYDLTLRNKKGDTPYSIAVEHKNQKLIELLDQYQQKVGDVSKKTTEDLLDQLLKEEERQAQEKAKRKEKKKKSKLKHIAEKEGVSIEEIEARHQAENELKRKEEERLRLEEEERVRKEFEAAAHEQRRRQERERQIFGVEES
jgi:hypothetical protein